MSTPISEQHGERLLDIARRTGLRQAMHGVAPSTARVMLAHFFSEAQRELCDPELKDHEIREAVNVLRDTARSFHAHQSLRERIAMVVVPLLRRSPHSPSPDLVRAAYARGYIDGLEERAGQRAIAYTVSHLQMAAEPHGSPM